MKIKNSTAKKIAIDLVTEQIYCSLCNIYENLDNGYCEKYTEKQQDEIMKQAEKAASRALVKIDSRFKGCKIDW